VDDMSDDIIDCMARMKGEETPFAVVTVVRVTGGASARPGAKAVVRADGSVAGWVGGGCTLGAVRKAAAQALLDGRARLIRVRPGDAEPTGDGLEEFTSVCPTRGVIELFVEPVLPRPSLLVIGSAPVALALCDLAARLGFAVTAATLPGEGGPFTSAHRRVEGFDGLAVPHPATGSVVVATQGRRDRDGLKAAIATGAAYVAFVGSRAKMAKLSADLTAAGVPAAALAAVHSPAGLDIGAVTPEEIALSILAEIVRERRLGISTRSYGMTEQEQLRVPRPSAPA
jgi:xanthine dehydrogenase accessory factor